MPPRSGEATQGGFDEAAQGRAEKLTLRRGKMDDDAPLSRTAALFSAKTRRLRSTRFRSPPGISLGPIAIWPHMHGSLPFGAHDGHSFLITGGASHPNTLRPP
jgi:hypothetical protein